MTNPMIAWWSVLLALAIASISSPQAISASFPPAVARISFDETPNATDGNGQQVPPLQADGMAFTEGVIGRALLADKGIVLRYPRSLLPVQRGTVCLWVQPRLPVDQGGMRFFFSDGTSWGPHGMPRLWLMGSGRIRYDLDGGRRFFTLPIQDWPVGQWKHMAFSWDAQGGVTALYIDGHLVGQWNTPEPWVADPTDSFRIGSGLSMPGAGQQNRPAAAAIDQVAIFDRVLSADEIGQNQAEGQLPVLHLHRTDPVVASSDQPARLELVNDGYGTASGTAAWTDGSGDHSSQFKLAHAERCPLDISLRGFEPGLQRIKVSVSAMHGSPDHTLSSSIYLERKQSVLPSEPIAWRNVARIDCAQTPPDASAGPTEVVQSPIGAYRQAGPKINDRFAYCVKLSSANRLVRASVSYPDDRVRTTGVSNWGPMQEALGSGYSCGDETPISNAMQTRAFVFFCNKDKAGVVISTEGTDQPAAAAEIIIEEAAPQLSPAAPRPALGAKQHRRVGLYFEDPVLSRCFDEPNALDPAVFESVLARGLDYCDWIGLDALSYPAVWYMAPIYESAVCGGYPYSERFHPPDMLERIAQRCDQRGVLYYPSLNPWRLAPLIPHLLDLQDVIAGKPNVDCVDRLGRVIPPFTLMHPQANALHPIVQDAVIDVIKEIATKLRPHESFGGIDFMLWPGSILSLQGGTGTDREVSYDDYTIDQFASQIGQTPPGRDGDATRFAKRYEWINADAQRRAAWIDFRCQRIAEFYGRAAGALAAIAPAAKLGIAVYDPSPSFRNENLNINDRLRESGLDVALIAKQPNIIVRRYIHQMSPRYGLRTHRQRASDLNLSNSRRFNAPFLDLSNMGAILHQQYFETPVGAGMSDPRLGNDASGARWNSSIRVTEPLHSGRDCLRYYAFAVRNFDACEITVGGYVLGTQGIEPELRPFARSFTALPAVRFQDVSEDKGILVRTAVAEGSRWWYVLNLTADPADVSVSLPVSDVHNAATGQPMQISNGKAALQLLPYELVPLRSTLGKPDP